MSLSISCVFESHILSVPPFFPSQAGGPESLSIFADLTFLPLFPGISFHRARDSFSW